MSDYGHQYHHGVKKNLFDLAGGLIVGAAAVVFLTSAARRRRTAAAGEVFSPPADTLPEPAPKPRRGRKAKAAPTQHEE